MRSFGAKELLECYGRGVFPMAEGRDDPRIYLLDPDERGILPLDEFHIPRRLRRTVRQDVFQISLNRAFDAVVAGWVAPAELRPFVERRAANVAAQVAEMNKGEKR